MTVKWTLASPNIKKGLSFFSSTGLQETIEGIFLNLPPDYMISVKGYMIHTLSSILRLLSLSCLKWEGVNPVTFLNWAER